MLPVSLKIKRRLCTLTLARREWEEVADSLAKLPDAARYAPVVTALRAQLTESGRGPSEMVAVSQPPLTWSPLILGLAFSVLRNETLLPVAERLRAQMAAQAKKIESALPAEQSSGLGAWPSAPIERSKSSLAWN